MITTALYLLGGFLLGSIPFGYVLVRLVRGEDVRSLGSGNIGATNVGRVLGRWGWLATLLLDGGKGAVAVLLAWSLASRPEAAGAVAGLGAILGHCYTPWLGFRGGKGVATMLGTFALLTPTATLISAAAFTIVAVVSRYVSLASIIAAAVLPASLLWHGSSRPLLLAAGVTLVVVIGRHRDNIGRLLRGEESRIGGRS